MTIQSQFRLRGKNKDSYLELILDFPLASIRSDAHLVEAQKVIDGLLARERLNEGEATYLDALSDLVETYEDEHHAIAPASDADLLQQLLEARGLSQAQLSREAGLPRSTISEVLNGKRRFSRQMIHKLAAYFQIDAAMLAVNI